MRQGLFGERCQKERQWVVSAVWGAVSPGKKGVSVQGQDGKLEPRGWQDSLISTSNGLDIGKKTAMSNLIQHLKIQNHSIDVFSGVIHTHH